MTNSVFTRRADLLDHMQFKYGIHRGRLAAAMDMLSDLLINLGTHTAYCHGSGPVGQPARDMQDAMQTVDQVKELIASLLDEHHPSAPAQTGPEGRT